MSKSRKVIEPSDPTYLYYITSVTPEIETALLSARSLAEHALAKLREHVDRGEHNDKERLVKYESEYTFIYDTELPAIPKTITAIAPLMHSGKHHSPPSIVNWIIIEVLEQPVLRFSWMPEGYFWVTWFKRGSWEQHLLSQIEHQPDTSLTGPATFRTRITTATSVQPPASDTGVEGGTDE